MTPRPLSSAVKDSSGKAEWLGDYTPTLMKPFISLHGHGSEHTPKVPSFFQRVFRFRFLTRS